MVKRVHALALLCLFTTTGQASGGCTPGTEFEPPLCPIELPAIRRVIITQNAAKSPAEQDPSVRCAGFRLAPSTVRKYLVRARATTARDAHFTLAWSPCYATGKVIFDDGRVGRWNIDQFRLGTLAVEGAEPEVLYCPDCEFKPFIW